LPADIAFGKQNLTVETLRSNLVNMTLTTNVLCNATNGIIRAEPGVGDTALVQGLGALYHAMNGPADLVAYIGSVLSVQYNAITTSATNPNSNIYAASWSGPPVVQYDLTNQTMALFGLVNAAQVTSTESNSTSPSPVNDSDSSGRKKSLAGPIAGGVVGAGVLLATISFVVFYTNRRRRRKRAWRLANFDIDASESAVIQDDVPRPLSLTVRTGHSAWHASYDDEKRPQREGITRESNQEQSSSTNAVNENTPSTTDAGRLGEIPTNDLLQLLQARIQQEGRAESEASAPPAYEDSDSHE